MIPRCVKYSVVSIIATDDNDCWLWHHIVTASSKSHWNYHFTHIMISPIRIAMMNFDNLHVYDCVAYFLNHQIMNNYIYYRPTVARAVHIIYSIPYMHVKLYAHDVLVGYVCAYQIVCLRIQICDYKLRRVDRLQQQPRHWTQPVNHPRPCPGPRPPPTLSRCTLSPYPAAPH